MAGHQHIGSFQRKWDVDYPSKLPNCAIACQRDEMTPVIPGQTIAIDLETVKGFRPTYRLLSYCLASNGFPVSHDLAGVDRPDLVNSLVGEAYSWAGLAPPH